MAHVHSMMSAHALNGSVLPGEDHGFPSAERDDLHPRLSPRALLGEHELAAGEVGVGIAEQHRHLEREELLAVASWCRQL